MRVIETVFAMIVAVVFTVLLPILYRGAHMDKVMESNVAVETEKFLKKAIEQGSISINDCDVFINELLDSGGTGDFTVSVSQYEYDVDGTYHRYDTSWEEITTCLIEEGRYDFQTESYVVVTVKGRRTSFLSELSSVVKTEYFVGK